MSDRETVLELVKRLPPNVSLREIVKEIEFIAAVKEGLEEIDQGLGVSIESVIFLSVQKTFFWHGDAYQQVLGIAIY